jgi:hypothetical protein
MDRREFLAQAGLVATWAGIVVTVGCSEGGDGGTQPGGGGNVSGDVSSEAGHSHFVSITAAQVTAGQAVALSLTGGGHFHQVHLTAEEVMDIGAGTEVQKDTDSDGTGHVHTVTFN